MRKAEFGGKARSGRSGLVVGVFAGVVGLGSKMRRLPPPVGTLVTGAGGEGMRIGTAGGGEGMDSWAMVPVRGGGGGGGVGGVGGGGVGGKRSVVGIGGLHKGPRPSEQGRAKRAEALPARPQSCPGVGFGPHGTPWKTRSRTGSSATMAFWEIGRHAKASGRRGDGSSSVPFGDITGTAGRMGHCPVEARVAGSALAGRVHETGGHSSRGRGAPSVKSTVTGAIPSSSEVKIRALDSRVSSTRTSTGASSALRSDSGLLKKVTANRTALELPPRNIWEACGGVSGDEMNQASSRTMSELFFTTTDRPSRVPVAMFESRTVLPVSSTWPPWSAQTAPACSAEFSTTAESTKVPAAWPET